jgi:hypothetical protein
VAKNAHLAAAARPVSLQDLDRGRLAGAVWPQQAENLTTFYGEVDPANCLVLAITLAQTPYLDRGADIDRGASVDREAPVGYQ